MSTASRKSLPDALELAASELPELADQIRPANGHPDKLLSAVSAEEGARILEWLLRHEPGAGAELCEAWCDEPEAGSAVLLQLSDADLPKVARKALRRAHHQLRSRGVALPDAPAQPVVAKLPPVEDGLEAALVSSIDPRGTRVAYVVTANPSGGARLFEIVLDEERGVVSLEVYGVGRSKVRKFLREISGRGDLAAVEAPTDSVRALVARVAAAQPSDRALPRGFAEWRSSVAQASDATPTPGQLAREALGEDAAADAVERLAGQVREGRLGPWPPAAERLRPVAEKIAEVAKGRILVSGLRRREQVDQVIDEALAEIFGDGFAEVTARRLEESAYVLWKTGREDEARDALAGARALREGQGATPLSRAVLERALEPVLGGLEEELRSEDEPSLLVKP